jgi:hypothetical protein
MISYRHNTGPWLNAEQGPAPTLPDTSARAPGRDARYDVFMALEDLWI